MDEPTSFRAGDSASWTASLPDYLPSAGWTLKYRLLPLVGVAQDITATPAGDSYAVAVTPTESAAWAAGSATLVKIVEKGAQKITLLVLVVQILPDLSVAASHDGRTANEKGLADAEAALAAYVAAGQMHVEGYEIAGRSMKFRTVQDIKDLINHYRAAVAKDNAVKSLLAGGSPPGRVYYRG
jgi:hypothetical protein